MFVSCRTGQRAACMDCRVSALKTESQTPQNNLRLRDESCENFVNQICAVMFVSCYVKTRVSCNGHVDQKQVSV